MEIEFDPAKDRANRVKHRVSLALAAELEWETALIWTDNRRDCGEVRRSALVLLGDRLYSWPLWIATMDAESSACARRTIAR